MINRDNWADVRRYLVYKERVEQSSLKTVKHIRGGLRHLLEWADDQPLNRARLIDPTFPVYLLSSRADGKLIRLSPASLDKICEHARGYFKWCRLSLPQKYKGISEAWIETLRPGRAYSMQSQLIDRQIFTLEEVRKVLAYQPDTEDSLRMKRDRAAIALLFLSGMRAGAFVTIPMDCVFIDNGLIVQDPSRGVATKNNKAARTFLLDIPDLRQVTKEWDSIIREKLPPTAPWYCRLERDGWTIKQEIKVNTDSRRILLSDGMKVLCERAGVSYKSPHKLRHGHAVFSLKKAKDMGELKAISQNLMHSNIATTEGLYGKLVEDDVRNVVTHLSDYGPGKGETQEEPVDQDTLDAIRIMKILKANPNMLEKLTGAG